MRAPKNVPRVGRRRRGHLAYVFKTIADPYSGKLSLLRVFGGVSPTLTLVNSRTHGKERIGQLLVLQGKDHEPSTHSARR